MGTGWYYLYKALNKSNSSSKSKSSGDIYIDGSSNIYRKLLTAIIYDDFVGAQRLLNSKKEECFGEAEDVSPICIAIEGGRYNMVNLLASKASDVQKRKAFCDAAAYNDVEIMKYLAKNILKDVKTMESLADYYREAEESIKYIKSAISTLIDCKNNGQFDDISETIKLLNDGLQLSLWQFKKIVLDVLIENKEVATLKNLSDSGNMAATYFTLKLAAETDDIQLARQLVYNAKGNFQEIINSYHSEYGILDEIKSFEMLDLLLSTDCITLKDDYSDRKESGGYDKFKDEFIQGDKIKLQKFIKRHINKINSMQDRDLFKAVLDTAIELKDFESLKYLIKNDMIRKDEVKLQSENGLKYDWETTKFFMDNGIKPSLHEFDCDIKMLNYMKKNYLIDEKNIGEAISGASFENVKYLIDNGYKDKVLSKFDIAAYNYNIHSSSSDERRIIVECLIKQGALDLDVNKNADITAKCQEMLKTALLNKDAKVAALLSERGFKLSDCKLSNEESKKLNENLRKSLLDGNLEYARISIKQGVKLYDKKILKDMYPVTKRKCKKEIKQARKIIIKNKLTKKESEDYKKLKAEKNAKIKKHTEVR